MNNKKNFKANRGYRTRYRFSTCSKDIEQVIRDLGANEIEFEKIKVKLLDIEKSYYSSNIQLERIKKRKYLEIIRSRISTMLELCKRSFNKSRL